MSETVESPTVRKGVLLRMDPELLARVDRCKGGLKRTEWLVSVITREVLAIESAQGAQVAAVQSSVSRAIYDEDGSDMGLRMSPSGEIWAAEDPAADEYSQAMTPNGDSGLDGEPLGEPADLNALEGPDAGAFTSEALA